jgi:hypothetical protein
LSDTAPELPQFLAPQSRDERRLLSKPTGTVDPGSGPGAHPPVSSIGARKLVAGAVFLPLLTQEGKGIK